MKKIILLAICLMFGVSFTTYAQKNLEKNQQKETYHAELEDAMLGFRHGVEYSYRHFSTALVMGASKHGLHYKAGYRFTKHWYVGGIVGVDLTTPSTITREGYMDNKNNYSIEREDNIYVPVMADVRFYFKPRRVSTYIFTNLGAEFIGSTALICTAGLGWDIHVVKDQCVNIGLGVGTGGWESAYSTHGILDSKDYGYDKYTGFVLNIKLGYSF